MNLDKFSGYMKKVKTGQDIPIRQKIHTSKIQDEGRIRRRKKLLATFVTRYSSVSGLQEKWARAIFRANEKLV